MASRTAAEYGGVQAKALAVEQPGTKRRAFLVQILLRGLATALTAAAIPVMVKSNQATIVFGIPFEARYSYFAAFKFIVAVDAVVCAFSLVSLLVLCRRCAIQSESGGISQFLLYSLDTVVTLLTMAGCSAAAAVGYIGYYGVESIGWPASCEHARYFCAQILSSVTLSFLTLFSYITLVLMTTYKLTAR